MGALVKTKNVGGVEGLFRSVIGVVLIILAFLVSGFGGWILGSIGVMIILTAIFGY